MVDVERLLKGQASLPPAPAAADEPFDPTISDVWRAEDLGVQSPENVPCEAVNNTVSRALPAVETPCQSSCVGIGQARQLAVCCGGSIQQQKAPEAKPASAVKEKSMKWQKCSIAMLCIATMIMGYTGVQMDKQVNSLTSYYLEKEYGPNAMNGKTYVEVTPQVEGIGTDKFVPIVARLPYTDSATLERLFNEEDWVVAKTWGEGAGTVVQMSNWYYDFLGCLDKEMAGLNNENRPSRSVLIHPNPASLKVYTDAKECAFQGRINAEDFAERKHYAVAGIDRLIAAAAMQPPATYEELATLGDMYVMNWDGSSHVLHLVNAYGSGERFVHLSGDDYLAARAETLSDNDAETLKRVMSYTWWYDHIAKRATKEEQTAVK
ncbi:MAG: hypothetical protein Q7R85_00010 [bacterium]|nr:hypothetical protein [bacterium]